MKRTFTRTLFSFAVFAVAALTATAQSPLQGRSAASKATAKSALAVSAKKDAAPHFAPAKVVANPTDYGTESVILFEDFSKFATGSIEDPDYDAVINYQNDDNAWINMENSYTSTPGWGSHEVFPAGGCAYLDTYGGTQQAQINTPMLDCSANGKIVFLQFKARTAEKNQTANYAIIEAAETYNMSPTWDFLGSSQLPAITNEWQTYEVMYYGAGSYTLFSLVAQDASIVIDDLKVYQIDQYTDTPECLGHRYYKGTDFNVRWTKAEGADSYLLNIYTANERGEAEEYLLKDQSVSDTTYNVTGAYSGETYYYTVRSVKGEHVSIESEPLLIYDIAPTTMEEITDKQDGSYVAHWAEVPEAERYNYLASYKRTATEDGEFVVTDLNFDGVRMPFTAPNDTLSGWTLEDPSYQTTDSGIIWPASQAGWVGYKYAPYTDYICLDGWWTVTGGKQASLQCCPMDLSHDGGNVKVTVDLYGDVCYNELGFQYGYAQCAIALFSYDEETDDYVQKSLVYPTGVKNQWGTFTAELTGGSKESIVGLFAVTNPENLYVDNLKITQQYKKGEELLDPFYFGRWIDGVSVAVEVPKSLNGCELYHRAQAVRSSETSDGYMSDVEFTESYWTDYASAGEGFSVGIHNATAPTLANATALVENGRIVVNAAQGTPVSVYAANGAQVFTGNGASTTSVLPHGTYIVKAGKQSVKVTF